MKIYTKTGDKGQTSLFNGERVWKSDLRLQVEGELDMLGVTLGWCKFYNENPELKVILERVATDIFNLSAILAGADSLKESLVDILEVERWIDEYDSQMPELKNFVYPGGSEINLYLHEARVVTRKVERLLVELSLTTSVEAELIAYLNRLSDLWFVLARFVNFVNGVEDLKYRFF